jgi:hypothetical protein
MNWHIDHTPLPGFIRISVEGKPSLPDYQRLWQDVITHDGWKPGTPILKDIRNREPLGSDGFDIVHAIAEYLVHENERVGDSLVAIVTDQEHGFRYGRVLEYAIRMRKSQVVIRTFGNEESAINWLGQKRA